jgi:olfactory receptor
MCFHCQGIFGLEIYLNASNDKTVQESKIIAVFYNFVSTLLNPLIYSLRNKDVKQALKTILRQKVIRTALMPPPSNNCNNNFLRNLFVFW